MPRKTVLTVAAILGTAALAIAMYLLVSASSGKSRQMRELDAHARTWQSRNVTHYQMKVSIGCFCPFRDRMPLAVEVLNGKLISVTDASGQAVPESDPVRSMEDSRLLTVDGLFAYAEEAIRTAGRTEISYDPQLGYPVSLNVDRILQAVDDELGVQVSDLRVLP